MPRPTIALLCLLALMLPAEARASIADTSPIDGPSPDIIDFGGTAMAPDGTGGLVYRKRVDGRAHIFAAQYVDRRWRAPQRVDNGQAFDSSWPAIGAGNGGRVVVSWVQEFGPSSDRMYSAAIDPGARRFQPPTAVDLNVGESTGTVPSLAMNGSGAAYLAYLVMERPTSADLPGYARGELRVARYSGSLWSSFGFPLNRNPASPLRLPTRDAGPRVAIDPTGNGILAWQEPDDGFVDRVWARRLFGAQTGLADQVSPSEWGGQALRAGADQHSLDTAGFGQGAIAFRQQPAPGGGFEGVRVMLATIPETTSPEAARFGEPRIVDNLGAHPAAVPGPAAVAVSRTGEAGVAFGIGQRSLLVGADDRQVRKPERLDDGRTAVGGEPQADVGASGAAVAAWRVGRGRAGGVGLTERRADGVPTSRVLSAPAGGSTGGFALAGSGLGDALVGWAQGTASAQQIAATVVDAPPDPFAVQTPIDFVRRRPVRLTWDRPASAIGRVRFAVTLDDDTVAENVRGTSLRLRRPDLRDGVSVAQVVAEDSGGQETSSFPADLKVDGRAPRVRVRRFRNRLVEVRINDGRRGRVSGVARRTIRILWGDGARSRGKRRETHRYGRGGTFRLRVTVRDKARNRRVARPKVAV